jgi:polyphosphate kinase
VRVKVDTNDGRFLCVNKDIYNANKELFGDYQVKNLKQTYILIDPQMQIFNERINNLLKSVHQELQIILEWDAFELLKEC